MPSPVAMFPASKVSPVRTDTPEPVKDPSLDEMKRTISASLQGIDTFKGNMNKLVETLRQTLGNDCTFVAIKDCDKALASIKETEKLIRECRNALKKRGKQLLK